MAKSTRNIFYQIAKFIGDWNAVKKARLAVGVARRTAGEATGRGLRKLFK